jgi:hypothetical protein
LGGGVWGGGRRYGALNLLKHAIDILQHVVIPKAQDAIAIRFKNFRPFHIGVCPHCVLSAVDLDDEASPMRSKISDVAPNPNLAPKVRVGGVQSASQMPPELALGIGRLGSHLARERALRRCSD